jgi:hypothetical protein
MSKELKDQFGKDIPRAQDSASVRGQMISEATTAVVAEEVSEEKPKAKKIAKKANK